MARSKKGLLSNAQRIEFGALGLFQAVAIAEQRSMYATQRQMMRNEREKD